MAEVHTLVVTRQPCPADVDGKPCAECVEQPELLHDIECPGVTDSCRLWQECREDHDPEELAESGAAHGVEHQLLDCGWSVPTDRCWVQYAVGETDASDAARDLASTPGRYPVVHDGNSEDDFALGLAR